MAAKPAHVVSLPVNGAWRPTDIAAQQVNRADFYARQGEWVVLNGDGSIAFTCFAHFDEPEQRAAERFARSLPHYHGEAQPLALRVQPYWYAAAYGPVEADKVRPYKA